MTQQAFFELIGYAASIMVAISLMMSSILRLRILNMIGAALFAFYGIAIGSLPVAAVNLFIIGVNLWYLARMLRAREHIHVLEVTPDAPYLHHFLDYNRKEIRRFQPEFELSAEFAGFIFFVLRDVVPAGIIVCRPLGAGTLYIELDYVMPGYRDMKVARYLYDDHADLFLHRGFDQLVTQASTREHAGYLRRVGFTDAGDGRFVRALS